MIYHIMLIGLAVNLIVGALITIKGNKLFITKRSTVTTFTILSIGTGIMLYGALA